MCIRECVVTVELCTFEVAVEDEMMEFDGVLWVRYPCWYSNTELWSVSARRNRSATTSCLSSC